MLQYLTLDDEVGLGSAGAEVVPGHHLDFPGVRLGHVLDDERYRLVIFVQHPESSTRLDLLAVQRPAAGGGGRGPGQGGEEGVTVIGSR